MVAASAFCANQAVAGAIQEAEGTEKCAVANPDLERPPDHERRMQWWGQDFSSPEQTITASKGDWESCMTLNGHWRYGAADRDWKPPATVMSNLIHCGAGGGNFLLNIGPRADGSVPAPRVEILKTVGTWMRANGSSIGLPLGPPDEPVAVLALEFDSPPTRNSMATRLFVDSSILIEEQMKKGWG
jgi:hypothetical protein